MSCFASKIESPWCFHTTAILTDFDIPLDAGPALFWIDLATKSSKQGLHRRAHRNNQGPPRPVGAELRGAWDSFVGLLEVLLDEFEGRLHRLCVFDRNDAVLTDPFHGISNHCADNRISRKALEQRGTLALAIIRAAAKGQELPELKNAGLAAIGIRLSEHCAYDQAFVGQAI